MAGTLLGFAALWGAVLGVAIGLAVGIVIGGGGRQIAQRRDEEADYDDGYAEGLVLGFKLCVWHTTDVDPDSDRANEMFKEAYEAAKRDGLMDEQ